MQSHSLSLYGFSRKQNEGFLCSFVVRLPLAIKKINILLFVKFNAVLRASLLSRVNRVATADIKKIMVSIGICLGTGEDESHEK